MSNFAFGVLQLAMFVPAIVLHEVAHGWVSHKLGDPTASNRGRLSLNPLKHVDPFGTVLLPLLLFASGLPVFGYAKPVPIDPRYYKDYRKGMMLTGLAGPATNIAMAIVAGLAVRLIGPFTTTSGSMIATDYVEVALYIFAYINLVLAFFNLIPMPPLDGSRVLPMFLSNKALITYHQIERYGIMIFFALVLVLPRLLGFSPISAYLNVTVDPILKLLTGIA